MSESDGEQAARSVALEQAYVHDVYEQYAEKTAQSRHWPRIYQFLEELEPGALVCDVGCGNGKYLSVNQSIFKVGADRCKKLTEIAREKENEVLICDNLALPFRDESFDAVLSIAVVHHFATTERRVHALKELARVLRIGGRLVISVWAMEQRHRKFESQDVLVPWPKAYCLGSSLNRTRASGIPFADEMNHNQTVQKDTPISKRASQQKCRSKSYWIDPVFSPSPSTSSLSSPNETCYSFFRRALQKLAGGKRGPGSRPWFLENWHNGADKERRYIEHEDSEDIDDLPIELRRLEDINVTINKFPDTLSIKSKSLGDIIEIQRHDLVRSRSSIPGLCSTLISDTLSDEQFKTSPLNTSKPRLVKQKSHFIDDICLEIPETTAIQEIIKDLPDFQVPTQFPTKRANVHKQNSMNEELMSMERLQERERVRQNIMKQASLNEEIMCKGKTFEALKDSIYSGNATKRFQLLKSGLTNKIKQSTTNMEKVSGMSIKNGFVRILQGWKSGETEISTASTVNCELVSSKMKLVDKIVTTVIKRDVDSIERRLSREDGSDSSKDSSLQSDTSVDSEDSFASVIYVPKQDVSPLVEVISAPPRYQLNATSAPPSPHVKHPPDFTGSRLKLVPISPLLKQFPATSKSLPPPSPPRLSPRTFTSFSSRPLFGPFPSSQQMSIFDKLISGHEPESTSSKANDVVDPQSPKLKDKVDERGKTNVKEQKFSLKTTTVDDDNYSDSKAIMSDEAELTDDTASLIPALEDALTSAQEKIAETFLMESINEEESRKDRLNQIKELLKQKPGFATRCAKPSFPLVRRASTAAPGRLETVTRPLPRLLSLDLFNPETDDADSDSSVVSSPESVGSVISVISDERFVVKKENLQSDKNGTNAPQSEESKTVDGNSSNSETTQADDIKYDLLAEQNPNGTSADAPLASPHSLRLLEAAANVASSLEDAVETAIQLKAPNNSHATRSEERVNSGKASTFVNPWKTRASSIDLKNAGDFKKTAECSLPEEKNWNEECRQHLIDFTEKLSENLIHDIDRYCQKTELELSKDIDGKSEDFLGSGAKSGVTADANDAPSTTPRYDDAPSRGAIESCKYSELVNTIARLSNKSTDEEDDSENDNKPSDRLLGLECSNADVSSENVINNVCMHRSSSENIMDFVLVSNNGEFINEGENDTRESSDKQRSVETTILRAEDADPNEATSTDVTEKPYLRFTNSIESSDIGDSIENTVSVSDSSQTESFQESIMAEKFHNDSTASLESTNIMCDDANDKRKVHNRTRSASEELSPRMSAPKQQASINSECLVTTATSNGTLSASSSQESLPSDHGGGSITYPQYYHVFREGELDQLINKYVENLHIISSYYDHASWCIVAEKVQVWTI